VRENSSGETYARLSRHARAFTEAALLCEKRLRLDQWLDRFGFSKRRIKHLAQEHRQRIASALRDA